MYFPPVIKTYLQIIYVILSLTKRRLRYTCWFCFETQESLYGIFISPLKFTQSFEIYVRFSHSHGKPLFLFPVVRNQLLPHPPRVALHELVSFQNSFRKKSSLVVLPRNGFRLRCAIGSRRPATCWLYNACPAPSMDTWRFPAWQNRYLFAQFCNEDPATVWNYYRGVLSA